MTCNSKRTNPEKNFNSLIFQMFLVTLCCLAFSGIGCDKTTSKPAKPQISITTKPAPAPGQGYQVAEDVRPKSGQKVASYSYMMTISSPNPRSTAQRLNASFSKLLSNWPSRGIGVKEPLVIDIPGSHYHQAIEILQQSGKLSVKRIKALIDPKQTGSVRITLRIEQAAATKPAP